MCATWSEQGHEFNTESARRTCSATKQEHTAKQFQPDSPSVDAYAYGQPRATMQSHELRGLPFFYPCAALLCRCLGNSRSCAAAAHSSHVHAMELATDPLGLRLVVPASFFDDELASLSSWISCDIKVTMARDRPCDGFS